MPQYPHRPIVQALDRLTEQVRRVAELLTAGAQQDNYALAPLTVDNVSRIAEYIAPPPDAEEHAQEVQAWLSGVTDVRAATENMTELARLNAKAEEQRAALVRVHDLHRPDQELCRVCATPTPCATLTAAILTP